MKSAPKTAARKTSHVLAISLLTAALGAGFSASVLAQDKPAAAAPAESMRPNTFKAFKAAQDLMNEKKFAEAWEASKALEAIPDRTPYETLMLLRLRAAIAQGGGDTAQIISSFEALLATGKLNAEETAQLTRVVGARYYEQKNYTKANEYLAKAIQADPNDGQMRRLYLQSLYLNKEYAKAVTEGQAVVAGEEKAGKVPDHDLLWLVISAAQQSDNTTVYNAVLEKLVTLHPKKEYWAEVMNKLESKPGFSRQKYELDLLRLKNAVGALSKNDYFVMGQAAQEAGFPIEGKKIFDEGYAKNILGSGSAQDIKTQADVRRNIEKSAAEDMKTLGSANLDKPGKASKDGNGQVNQGLALVQIGQTEKGLALMEKGMAAGMGARAEEGKLHYGVALALAGRKDDAIKTLSGVGGTDGAADLAKYWILHLKAAK